VEVVVLVPRKHPAAALTDEDADVVRDLCGEKLQTSGFESDYTPTDVGRRLERLVDKLYVG
jgi:hypothetical protein